MATRSVAGRLLSGDREELLHRPYVNERRTSCFRYLLCGFKLVGVRFLYFECSYTLVMEKIKSRLKSGNACYYSVQNILSSSLLSKNVKIKKYRTIILPIILYGCETWSLILREERRLRVFENNVLRTIFGPKRDEVTADGGNYIMRSLMTCTVHQILFG